MLVDVLIMHDGIYLNHNIIFNIIFTVSGYLSPIVCGDQINMSRRFFKNIILSFMNGEQLSFGGEVN